MDFLAGQSSSEKVMTLANDSMHTAFITMNKDLRHSQEFNKTTSFNDFVLLITRSLVSEIVLI